jgi:hypothetical protein
MLFVTLYVNRIHLHVTDLKSACTSQRTSHNLKRAVSVGAALRNHFKFWLQIQRNIQPENLIWKERKIQARLLRYALVQLSSLLQYIFAKYNLCDMWMETRKLFAMYNESCLPMPVDRPEKSSQCQQKYNISLLTGSSDFLSPFCYLHISFLSLDFFTVMNHWSNNFIVLFYRINIQVPALSYFTA